MSDVLYGTRRQVLAEFRDTDGDLFDPDPVTAIISQPDGTELSFTFDEDEEVVRDAEGLYSMWFLPTQADDHVYRWEGGGEQAVSNEGEFTVTRSKLASRQPGE